MIVMILADKTTNHNKSYKICVPYPSIIIHYQQLNTGTYLPKIGKKHSVLPPEFVHIFCVFMVSPNIAG